MPGNGKGPASNCGPLPWAVAPSCEPGAVVPPVSWSCGAFLWARVVVPSLEPKALVPYLDPQFLIPLRVGWWWSRVEHGRLPDAVQQFQSSLSGYISHSLIPWGSRLCMAEVLPFMLGAREVWEILSLGELILYNGLPTSHKGQILYPSRKWRSSTH